MTWRRWPRSVLCSQVLDADLLRDAVSPTAVGLYGHLVAFGHPTHWGPRTAAFHTRCPPGTFRVAHPDPNAVALYTCVHCPAGAVSTGEGFCTDCRNATCARDSGPLFANPAWSNASALANGLAHYSRVTVTNAAGLAASAVSDGYVWDVTAPLSEGPPKDGLDRAADINWTRNATGLGATWVPFDDPETPVASYAFAIGTSPGVADVLPFTDVGLRTAAYYPYHLLEPTVANATGTQYHVLVRGTNAAGVTSDPVATDGLALDATPPVGVYVHDGFNKDIQSQSFIDVMFANWRFDDPESGIQGYELALGSAPYAQDVLPFTQVRGGPGGGDAPEGAGRQRRASEGVRQAAGGSLEPSNWGHFAGWAIIQFPPFFGY